MKSIETVYNGYRFRSRLEARWAVFFDSAGIQYNYEPEGFELSDGTKYLPDFYLPESDTFFEVKGIMSDYDEHKIKMFISESEKALVIGYENMEFQACDEWWGGGYTIASKEESELANCLECGHLYFMGINGNYTCRCCGAYDGDGRFIERLSGSKEYRSEKIWPPVKNAMQARFEHGEKVTL